MSTISSLESSQGLAEVVSVGQPPTWLAGKTKIGFSRTPGDDVIRQTPSMLALSMEFVAIPATAQNLRELIAADMELIFQDVTSFAGCLVLASDQEARLVTVISLWSGGDRRKCCSENARWMKALLNRYVDRWLRPQTLTTSFRTAHITEAR